MTARNRARRFWMGFGLALLVIVAGFSLANLLIPNWGSTPEEQSQVLPGDEIFAKPVVRWKHAITINAKPEAIWPWLIQMGDTRGGFYSYRYIEKGTTAAAGIDASAYYQNANSIHPEWQSPATGQGMILDTLVLRDYKVNQYLVAAPMKGKDDAGLLWTWSLAPTADGRTRLIVHMSIQIPGTEGNKAVEAAFNLATFMMERKMMDGIKLRAEGGSEADWVQVAEAILWFLTLGIGLVAARRFMTRPDWKISLAIGLAAILVLFGLVYLQPALWLRVLIDLALIGALVCEARGEQKVSVKAEAQGVS